MKNLVKILAKTFVLGTLLSFSSLLGATHSKGEMTMADVSGGDSCIQCHKGIESIRDTRWHYYLRTELY